ncbi:MAG TPA: sulfate ABC transporter substrate-binding protein [Steroidobacteraceae bacterium]|nr:sulfate ABC transporter substrate-binding protein [Steroidobacteraceae bacterium]
MNRILQLVATVLAICGVTAASAEPKAVEILNASYDVSREVFTRINPAFQAQWKAKTGVALEIRQSHGGSTKQARAVAEGLKADVVTFNQVSDIDLLVKTGLVAAGWQKRLPNNASPYYSLPVFLVRAGNPKHIKDWDDLAKPGIQAIFPNPKTSGNGRYTYLGAYAYALGKNGGDVAKANAFVTAFLANVPVFDTGGRGATTTFVERQIGDVLVTFESEVISIRREYAKSELQVVMPSVSVRADFPVSVVDKVVDRRGTRAVATAYLQFLYSDEGQDILAQNFNRVRNDKVAQRYKAQFPEVRLVSIEDTFGGWDKVMKTHFADGGILDQALAAKR